MSRREETSSLRTGQDSYLGSVGRWELVNIGKENAVFKSQNTVQRQREEKGIYLMFLLKLFMWVGKEGEAACSLSTKNIQEQDKLNCLQNQILRLGMEWQKLKTVPRDSKQEGV